MDGQTGSGQRGPCLSQQAGAIFVISRPQAGLFARWVEQVVPNAW